MKLEIPEDERELLRRFLTEESDENVDELLSKLEKAEPALRPSDLARSVAAELEDDAGSAQTLVAALLHMAQAREGLHEVGVDAGDVLYQSLVGDPRGTAEARALFDQRVERIIQLRSIRITGKARYVKVNNAATYCGGRVFSELRPVFDDLEPAAALVAHQLRVIYHEGPRAVLEQMFFTMDRADLEELHEVLGRALDKDKKLAELAKRQGLIVLEARKGAAHDHS